MAATRAAPTAIRVICQPGMPPPVMKVAGAGDGGAAIRRRQRLCKRGGRCGQGQHGADERDHSGEDAPEMIHDALLGGGEKTSCGLPASGCRSRARCARTPTAARGAWNYLGICLERRLGIRGTNGGKWLARAAGWAAVAPGGVGMMAADAVAGETELAEFGILGPLEVSRSGRPVPLGGPRQRAVLALLLLEANRVVSLDRLAEDLWGGHPPEGWVTTVQIYVSHLRQALEPGRARGAAGEVLVTRNRGYLLRVDR